MEILFEINRKNAVILNEVRFNRNSNRTGICLEQFYHRLHPQLFSPHMITEDFQQLLQQFRQLLFQSQVQ